MYKDIEKRNEVSERNSFTRDIIRFRNRKILPKIEKSFDMMKEENEWQQEYKLIYDSYILEDDE